MLVHIFVEKHAHHVVKLVKASVAICNVRNHVGNHVISVRKYANGDVHMIDAIICVGSHVLGDHVITPAQKDFHVAINV